MTKIFKNKYLPYFIFAILSLMPIALIFNNNIWFDESYTLSLIKHNYSEILQILKADMHPPLYFVSLKAFCDIFGYSIAVTKIFSALGYIATLFLGCTVIKKRFGNYTSVIYMLAVSAVPMSLYFSTQQRSYSWCIFFVTLCFLEGILFVENSNLRHCVIFGFSALFAAYNHIYALIAVAVIFAFINIYILIKNRGKLPKLFIADAIVIIGYLPQLITLLNQTKAASNNFWLTELEPLSLIVFATGVAITTLVLIKKQNRNFLFAFAVTSILGIQVIGLGVSIILRPLYIARYSVVVLGIFSILIAMVFNIFSVKIKNIICFILCVLSIISFACIGAFEYDNSISSFNSRFETTVTDDDVFVYSDSAFGIVQYYYPQNRHICTYYKDWFEAFENVEYIKKSDVKNSISKDRKVWYVSSSQNSLPKWVTKDYKAEMYDEFKSDFNSFYVYSLTQK